jgi:hypothetical protein
MKTSGSREPFRPESMYTPDSACPHITVAIPTARDVWSWRAGWWWLFDVGGQN